MSKSKTPHVIRPLVLIIWSLLPSIAIYVGMYVVKSAVWSFVFYHCFCLVPAIIWGRQFWRPTFVAPKPLHIAILVVVAIIFTAIAVLVYELMGPMLLSDQGAINLLKEQDYSREIFWPISLYAIVVNPFFEELFWRGVVFNALDRAVLPKHFAIMCSSFGYALFHYWIFRLVLYPGWAEFGTILLAIYGAILALIYRKTGSILTTAIAHGLLTDTACIALIIDLSRKYPGAM
ncbi:MAG: CPBP family intramembrane metalloprotease [Candidatus Obscuribacterales bacterium]|jgi:membrane protease YdiL (CAAX protease family)|nr:CPBP family intramembrane metalloprotease [Candidatus Obscuribacterales bacterium]